MAKSATGLLSNYASKGIIRRYSCCAEPSRCQSFCFLGPPPAFHRGSGEGPSLLFWGSQHQK